MGCGAAEATGLGFVCFVVINPLVLSNNWFVLAFIFVPIFSLSLSLSLPPPPARSFIIIPLILQAESMGRQMKVPYFECSALTNHGVEDVFAGALRANIPVPKKKKGGCSIL